MIEQFGIGIDVVQINRFQKIPYDSNMNIGYPNLSYSGRTF